MTTRSRYEVKSVRETGRRAAITPESRKFIRNAVSSETQLEERLRDREDLRANVQRTTCYLLQPYSTTHLNDGNDQTCSQNTMARSCKTLNISR